MSTSALAHDPTDRLDGPPEEEFWQRYNKRLEFPLATVLLHAFIAALLVVVFGYLMSRSASTSGMPVALVEVLGQDEDGDGSPGTGIPDPVKVRPNPLEAGNPVPPTPTLPEAQAREFIDETTGTTPIAAANLADFGTVDAALLKKMYVQDGANKAAGDAKPLGKGPGGDANTAKARSLRWVMRFKTTDGQDYLDHLAAMGAVILVPLPPENKECLYFPNLKKISERKIATDNDLSKLAGQIKFSDTRPDSVRAVCDVLEVKEKAKSFWAFFPKDIEDELVKEEIGYRNRRAEDIEETIFQVKLRDGNVEIAVTDQTAKK